MTVTPSSFKIRFPEFATETDDRIQLFIDDAELILNATTWGTKYDLGVAYLAAHCLSIANLNSAGDFTPYGPLTGKAVDGTSISFASATYAIDDTFYASTSYGLRYISLRKSLQIAAYSITGS